MNNMQILGERIRHYRKLNSLTQKQLASEIGVAPLYIANIEQGRKGISLDKLVSICQWFNISLADILPMEERDDLKTKEKWIGEIVLVLETMESSQVGLIKTMICALRD